MKQPQYQPLQVWEMAITLFAVSAGAFDSIDMKDCLTAEKALREYVKTKHAALVDRIESTKDLSKEDEAELTKAIEAFKKSAGY
jgi:F-type H+-transporting ATPase subunit alpha